jgi:hypothetical protein
MKYDYVHCEHNLQVFAKGVFRRKLQPGEVVVRSWRKLHNEQPKYFYTL